MKKRNEGWTCYLKTDIARQVLWFSLALSAASLVVGIALFLQVQPSSAAQRRPQPETLPSDQFDASHFLTFNGVDDAVSACQYYRAIGAVGACGPAGQLMAPSFDFAEWKRRNRLAVNPDVNNNRNPFDDDASNGEASALYFNAVDLALVRSMHGKTSVVNGVPTTAYYVCNYFPSTFPSTPSREDILAALEVASQDPDNSKAGACVAFDYSANQPFTKFYVFKQGSLVASADLDGKGEKFVPGLCKVCHGGNNRDTFPGANDDAVNGNIGAHFLPFDLDNFEYLEDSAFSRSAQESKFKRLNQMILNTDPAPVVEQLIDGWYRGGRTEQDSQFIPSGWMGHEQLYRRVVKPSCRTCHVAMSENFNFNRFENLATDDRDTPADDTKGSFKDELAVNDKLNAARTQLQVCNARNMPNSKVTFDQFWLSRVQGAVLVRFLRDALGNPSITCPPP
jgi:hypothetical protein